MNEIRCAIELRADESRRSPGRLVGTLLTYGERASDRAEVFLPGALRWRPEGVIVNEQHNRAAPIVRAVPAVEGREVRIDARLPDTQRGRDAATNVREGVYTGLSVEFLAREETRAADGTREIRAAVLGGAALVDSASYTGSRVEVRGAGRDWRREILAWL